MTSSSGVHGPRPSKCRALPPRPPHPAGVSQRLGAPPGTVLSLCRRTHPHFPRKDRGETVQAGGEGNEFQFQTPLALGLGLSNKLILLQTCKGRACLPG